MPPRPWEKTGKGGEISPEIQDNIFITIYSLERNKIYFIKMSKKWNITFYFGQVFFKYLI